MATGIIMPKQGITVETCILTKWHKKKGDAVKLGDMLFSYETDKSAFDYESEFEGTLLETFYNEGDEVVVLVNVAAIGNEGEDVSALAPAGAAAAPVAAAEPAKAEVESGPTAAAAATVNTSGDAKVSPRARAAARRLGVNPSYVTPSGPDGRVLERDILSSVGATGAAADYAAKGDVGTGIGGRVSVNDLGSAPVQGGYADRKFSMIRRSIAKAMTASLQNAAQLTNTHSFDASDILAFRKAEKERGGKATINDIILFAVSRVLPKYPALNANMLDNENIREFDNVNLGVAVDTERGLMVPVIKCAEQKSLDEISKEAKELIKSAQEGSINPDLLSGGSFTVTNLGTLGVESFTPVLNFPQTGILGVCCTTTRVRKTSGGIECYPAMALSLTYDHRAVDGAPAARFAQELIAVLENFSQYVKGDK